MKGNHPTMEQFGAAREQLYQKVEADPTDPFLLTALALADVALGRKEEGMQEGRRAMGMRPVSEDAVDGPIIAVNVAWFMLGQISRTCFRELNLLIQMPGIASITETLRPIPTGIPSGMIRALTNY